MSSVTTRRPPATYSCHHPGETFAIGTLRSMIEVQARWHEDDLVRLKLLR
jgi:hypothetical protein